MTTWEYELPNGATGAVEADTLTEAATAAPPDYLFVRSVMPAPVLVHSPNGVWVLTATDEGAALLEPFPTNQAD